jgi:hypothetical protein
VPLRYNVALMSTVTVPTSIRLTATEKKLIAIKVDHRSIVYE